jgi:hypothetical protein
MNTANGSFLSHQHDDAHRSGDLMAIVAAMSTDGATGLHRRDIQSAMHNARGNVCCFCSSDVARPTRLVFVSLVDSTLRHVCRMRPAASCLSKDSVPMASSIFVVRSLARVRTGSFTVRTLPFDCSSLCRSVTLDSLEQHERCAFFVGLDSIRTTTPTACAHVTIDTNHDERLRS